MSRYAEHPDTWPTPSPLDRQAGQFSHEVCERRYISRHDSRLAYLARCLIAKKREPRCLKGIMFIALR